MNIATHETSKLASSILQLRLFDAAEAQGTGVPGDDVFHLLLK
jgi:hypothetical protein